MWKTCGKIFPTQGNYFITSITTCYGNVTPPDSIFYNIAKDRINRCLPVLYFRFINVDNFYITKSSKFDMSLIIHHFQSEGQQKWYKSAVDN